MRPAPGSYLAIAAAVIIAGALISASIFVAISTQPRTTTLTTTQTLTVISISTTTNADQTSSLYSSCYVDPSAIQTYVHIVPDSGSSLASNISILATPLANGTCYGGGTVFRFATNATGWAAIGALEGGAYFSMAIEYEGRNYTFSIPQLSLESATATLRIPSGTITLNLCHNSSCTTSNQTATVV